MRAVAIIVSLLMVALTISGFVYLDTHALQLVAQRGSLPDNLPDATRMVIEILLEDSRQMASWSLAVLGATALLVLRRAEQSESGAIWSSVGLVAVGCASIVSIYASEILVSQLVGQLIVGSIDLTASWLGYCIQLQTFALLGGVAVAALTAVPALFGRRA